MRKIRIIAICLFIRIITGRPARSAAMTRRPAGIVLLSGPKIGFSPRRGDTLPRGLLPRAKFHVYRGRNVGIQPQNRQNFEFWP